MFVITTTAGWNVYGMWPADDSHQGCWPMINQKDNPSGCSEEFAELCALSTSGELNAEELTMLDKHVASCGHCAALLHEYASLAHVGMAKLAADRETELEAPFGYNETKAEGRFVMALEASRSSWLSRSIARRCGPEPLRPCWFSSPGR